MPLRQHAPVFVAPLVTYLCLLLSGCGNSEIGTIYPVNGQVLQNQQPLKVKSGYVLLKPDLDKGNSTSFEPSGSIDPDGHYVIYTTQHRGAPPGWWGGDPRWTNPDIHGEYDGCAHGDGVVLGSSERVRIRDVIDGTSNTLMIGENKVGSCCLEGWAHTDSAVAKCAIPPNAEQPNGQPYPNSEWQNTYSFNSYHIGGVQFALTDGSVRFIGDSIDPELYRALATRGSGEVAQMP